MSRCSGPAASSGLPERDTLVGAVCSPASTRDDHRGVEFAEHTGLLRDALTFPTQWLDRAGWPPRRDEDRSAWIAARIGEDRVLYGPTWRQFLADARRARFENVGRLIELDRLDLVRQENAARLAELDRRRSPEV